MGISLAPLVSAAGAAGGTSPLGARRILAPEAAEAGAASSLGIGAGLSAPREEPPQPRRSRVEEVTAPLPGFYFFFSPPPRLLLRLGPWCSPTGSPAPLSCETGCGEGSWILVCRLLVPTQVSLLSMEEDIDTRKINNSFLRDHSYATEGNASPAAFRRWGWEQVEDRRAPRAAGRVVAEIPSGPGAGAGARLSGPATRASQIRLGSAR